MASKILKYNYIFFLSLLPTIFDIECFSQHVMKYNKYELMACMNLFIVGKLKSSSNISAHSVYRLDGSVSSCCSNSKSGISVGEQIFFENTIGRCQVWSSQRHTGIVKSSIIFGLIKRIKN